MAPINPAARVVDLTNGIVSFAGGNLSLPFTNLVVLTNKNAVVNQSTNKLTLTIGLANGTFSGTVAVPGTKTTSSFKGALLQNDDVGYGYFLGTNLSGGSSSRDVRAVAPPGVNGAFRRGLGGGGPTLSPQGVAGQGNDVCRSVPKQRTRKKVLLITKGLRQLSKDFLLPKRLVSPAR